MLFAPRTSRKSVRGTRELTSRICPGAPVGSGLGVPKAHVPPAQLPFTPVPLVPPAALTLPVLVMLFATRAIRPPPPPPPAPQQLPRPPCPPSARICPALTSVSA